jgi:hypothetical protein
MDINHNYRAMSPREEQVIMSTDYLIVLPIPRSELFGDRLKRYGIRDAQSPKATHDSRCLVDSEKNYLWAHGDPAIVLTGYSQHGSPDFILQAIATEFGTKIYSDGSEYGKRDWSTSPCYVPLDTPTDEEIKLIRAKWRAKCEALDEELKRCLVLWGGEEISKEP